MNKTLRILNIIKKLKKIKPTYLNWKTFNAKQTWIHVPKIVSIFKKLNKLTITACEKQIQQQQKLLMYIPSSIGIINNKKVNITSAEYTKSILFNSAFNNNRSKNNTSTQLEFQYTNNTLNTGMQYVIYMILLNMYTNIKKAQITTTTLPRKRTLYTVLKSPHADKKAREQFMKELFNVRISIKQHVALMRYMNSIVLSYTKAFVHSYKYNAFYENRI